MKKQKIDFEKIKNTKWYRQRTNSVVYFILGPLLGVQEQLKKDVEIILELRKDSAEFYFDEQKFYLLAKRVLDKYKENRNYISRIYSDWKKVADELQNLADQVKNTKLGELTDSQLLATNKKLGLLSKKIWRRPIFMDIFDPNADIFIEQELSRHHIKVGPDDIKLLIQPPKLLTAQNYRLDLLRMIGKRQADCQTIIDKYYFINSSYAESPQLTDKQVKGELKDLGKTKNLKPEIKKLSRYQDEIRHKTTGLHKKYHFTPWLKDFFGFISFLALWRDERKTAMQKSFFALGILGAEIAKRSGIPWRKLNVCPPYEIDSIPAPKNLITKYGNLLKNNHFFIYNGKKGQFIPYDKKQSNELRKALNSHPSDVKEILGQIACPGKVCGKAKIIYGEKDFAKFQKGDVLVTAMTRPEFLPLMKKALAVITDEGGITSHAAIVSRELNIPCLIGTRAATKILKTGDLIEVNANHGWVKKLS